MPSNKSSNPNPRSSEISNPMRRSFTGNPFPKPTVIANPRTNFPNTPANSPSDFPRRSSVGIRESAESLRGITDDKENGKDHILKPAKIRSPAASSRSTKNFMSPTISASCKVNESPRKKVLAEKNECVPSSVDTKSHVRKVTFAEPLEEKKFDALFDGISPNFEDVPRSSLTSEDFSGESETTVNDMNVPLIPKNAPNLSFETVDDENVNVPLALENAILPETVAEEPDCVNLDPTFKLSPTATPPYSMKATILAPLDADPLMPPYDPKTNYLSPRPQFLHYKPRPRVELCSERELEDSFISGSFSDTEVTEDTQSEGSQKESEDVSSVETQREEESQISEPSSPRRTLMPEETVEAKEAPKPCFTVRAKAIALILLLAVAFVSISSVAESPVIDQTVLENFYKVYESSELPEFTRANFDRFSQFAKARFDELTRNLHTWFTKSLCSISEFISDVRGAHNLAKLQYYNLTVLDDYTLVDQYPIFGHGENEMGDTSAPVWNAQDIDAAPDTDNDENIEDISEEHYEVYEEQVLQDIGAIAGVENALGAPESEEVLEAQPVTMIESEQALQLAEAVNSETKEAQEGDANLNVENQPSLKSEVAEISIETCGIGNIDTKQALEDDAEFNVNKQRDIGLDSEVAEIDTSMNDDYAEGKSETIDAAIRGNKQGLEAVGVSPHIVLYVLLCAVTVLIAGAAFNRSRKSRSRSKSKSSVEQPLCDKELHDDSSPSREKEQVSPDKASLRNGPVEMDVLGKPCPSEMSSFEQSSSYSKKVVKELNETAQSMEKKRKNNYRRESLASSTDNSMSSCSYGSLTVYEKIPRGQGHDEETIITPVRRSSRIRNLATSPS